MKVDDALQPIRRLFLDTAPIVYHVEGHEAHQPLTDFIFQRISAGQLAAAVSPITLAECLVHPLRKQDLPLAKRFRDAIVSSANTTYTSLDAVAESAADLRARYNLSLADAFQVASALESGCDGFLTNDHDLKRVLELSILVLDELEL